jgi:uncharacterized protein YbbC (DUF1343 family)
MKNTPILSGILTGLCLFIMSIVPACAQLRTGAEQMENYLPLLKGRSVAVVANKASVVGKQNVVDTLLAQGIRIIRIFSPEHGFRGYSDAGAGIENFTDPVTGVDVISLYGKKRKPSAQDLKGIDLMLFDIQDVGVRFYTYISTLTLVMEACAENMIPLVLLDRPNPNAFYIDGPALEKEFESFVGLHPVPLVYGMTIGEYAMMVNGEGWMKNSVKCRLNVIKLENFTHRIKYMLPDWPSPNLVSMNAIYLYPSLCLFEGTMMSVGRGTLYPFEVFGHPDWLKCSFTFVPRSIQGMSLHPLYEGKECRGIDLRMITRDHPEYLGKLQLSWLIAAYTDLGTNPGFFNNYFEQLAGTAKLRDQIIQGLSEEEIRETWQDDLEKFKLIRARYLLYKDL